MRGFLSLLRWEFYKVWRRPGSYIGIFLCALFCVLIMVVIGLSANLPMSRTARDLTHDPSDFVNGYFFVTFILYFAHKSLLPLLAALIPGAQIAGEARDGTLRALLTRPPSRLAIFASKLIVSYVWLLLTIYFLIAFALIVGLSFLGGGDFVIFVWELPSHGIWFADQGDWPGMFLLAGFGAGAGLFIIVALSLGLSALTDNPMVAYVGAVGGYFISWIVVQLPLPQFLHPAIRRALPTSHTSFWHELYWLFMDGGGDSFDHGRFVSDIKWCAMYSAIFLAVGLVAFLVRDIKS